MSAGRARPGDLVARFAERARAATTEVVELPTWAEVAAFVADRAGGRPVAVAPAARRRWDGLVSALEGAGVEVLVPAGGDPAAEAADAAVGVVAGELAVAETGSVLVAEHDLADRVVSMLCPRLVQVVAREQVVADLDDVAAWLGARGGRAGFASLQTGPSRTADIERSLTIGVQGPDHVDVVVRA